MSKAAISVDQIEKPEISKKIIEETEKTLGFAPNMYQNMGANGALLDSYTHVYNSFRSNSGFNSVEQEVVLLSAAYVNNCEYCVAAHSFVGDKMSNVPEEVTDAIRAGKTVPDEKLNALSEFTKKMTVNRGWVEQADVDAFLAAGYDPSHVLGVIAGIGAKTMSNYSNHLTHPELDEAFAARKWVKPS